MDTQKFADWVVETAENLKCAGQLSPTGFALTKDGKITGIHAAAEEGDDPVEMLFDGLRTSSGELAAAAVALDMVVGDPETGERHDALWVHVEDDSGAVALIELYDEDDDDIEFEEPRTQRCDPRIFVLERADDGDALRAELTRSREPGLVEAAMPMPEGADPSPLLVFMEGPEVVNVLAARSTLPTYYAATLEDVSAALEQHSFCGIFACSPMEATGAAYEAIQQFRRRNPGKLVIYQSWDYRMEIAAKRALRAKADVLMVGGWPVNELLRFIFEALELKARGDMPAPDAGWYEAYLSETIPGSNRLEVAEMMRERQLPPSATR